MPNNPIADFDAASVDFSLQLPEKIPLIAEIGINHNGDVDIAKELIDLAHRSGAWAVKFQKRSIETVYSASDLSSNRQSPWGSTFRQQKEGLEFSKEEYDSIADFCAELGIAWSASAWDTDSLVFLDSYDLPFNKVASAMTTHLPFVREVASRRKLTFLSTGMCSLQDVERAVDVFDSESCPLVLMHSVSTYPAVDEDLNLQQIGALRSRFGKPVGYSGHESSVSPSIVAAALGAVVIERHITLDRSMYGSDQAASLAPDGLSSLIKALRRIPSMLGSPEVKMLESEKPVAEKLRYWN